MISNDTRVYILVIDPTYVECVRRAFPEAMRCGDTVSYTHLTLPTTPYV